MLHACAPGVPAGENPGLVLGTILGRPPGADRQADPRRLPRALRPRGLARAARRGVDRQGGQGHHPRGSGAGRRAGRLRRRPPVRLPAAGIRAGPGPGRGGGRARGRWPAGRPIRVATPYDLGEEFVRWEIATAIAGALIGINPFNQPDVEASKVATRALTSEYEKTAASSRPRRPFFEARGDEALRGRANAAALRRPSEAPASLVAYLRAHSTGIGTGDYFAVLGYLPDDARARGSAPGLRQRVRDARRVATCLGFGPRFLHSTGQALQGRAEHRCLPAGHVRRCEGRRGAGQKYTFGVVKAAQARGDCRSLRSGEARAARPPRTGRRRRPRDAEPAVDEALSSAR